MRGQHFTKGTITLIIVLICLFSVADTVSALADLSPALLSSQGNATDLPDNVEEKDIWDTIQDYLPYAVPAAVCIIAVIVVWKYIIKTRERDDGNVTPKVQGTGLTEPLPKNGFERPGYTEPQPQKDDFVRNDTPNVTDPSTIKDINETKPLDLNPEEKWKEWSKEWNAGPVYCLSCKGGYFDGQEIPFGNRDGNSVTIGRDPACGIKYPDDYPGISHKHAELRIENGEIFLIDTSSTGTLLKRFGKVIPKGKKIPVNVGDVFYLGERKNRFEIIAKY